MRRVFAGARRGLPRRAGALDHGRSTAGPVVPVELPGLRASIAKLDPGAEDYFTVEVVGTLRDVQSDGVLAYMIMCSPPDPQVLCVTYTTGDRKKGDSVILAGTYSQRGPDHVMLDPCLHHSPEPSPGR
jgi:hypothetical protein